MTEQQAIMLAESNWWETCSYKDRALFQLFEPRLCMPFAVFHEAIEKTLGRAVFTHEFALNTDGIKRELLGDRPAPTMREILELIPADKRIVVIVP